MKQIMLTIIFMLLLCVGLVSAVSVPENNLDNQIVINKIDKEHKDTRQYISSELSKSDKEFFNEFDSKATYYESSYKSIIRKAVFMLIIAWGGVVLFVNGFFHLIRIRLEKKKYNKLKESLKIDLKTELINLPKEIEEQNKTIFFKKKMMAKIKGGEN